MGDGELLVRQVEELIATESFAVFAAFVRRGDVRRWICGALNFKDIDYTKALTDLDYRRAQLLPLTIEDIAPKTEKKLRAIFEFVKVQLRKKGVRGITAAVAKAGEAGETALPRLEGAPDWRLRLPVPPVREELKKISPTRLDSYLRCPFTWFLRRKDVLGDRLLTGREDELERWEYGNLVHEALEAFGGSELADSSDADAIAAFLAADIDRQLGERFGFSVPEKVARQRESVKERLANFAAVEAARRRSGWRIAAVELKLEYQLDHTLVYGKCDRIDVEEPTGRLQVIDYKSYDTSEGLAPCTTAADGTTVWRSLQLPLYCAMLLAPANRELLAGALKGVDLAAGIASERLSAGYAVLGKTAEHVRFTEPFGAELVPAAEMKARELIAGIERGVFWPPAPRGEWRREFGEWLGEAPERTVDAAWLADQRARTVGTEN